MTLLALRALGIGDLATAVPALRALRVAYPAHRTVLAAPNWLAPLVELTGAVDRLVPLSGLDGDVAGLPSPAVAANLHGRGPESHRLLAATRPERLLAFGCPAAGHLDGPQWNEDEHEVLRWCRLLEWYGIPTYPDDLSLHVPAAPPLVAGAAIVHPGASTPDRRWSPRRFAAVARQLEAAGHHVVVTGSAPEATLARRVAQMAGLPAERVLAGRTDLAGLAALVASARLVVSGDTGIAHLATAYATPSVALFGPTPPAQWGPPPARYEHRALWRGRRGLASIPVSDVLDAVSRLPGERDAPAGPGGRDAPAGPLSPGRRPAAARAAAPETA